MQFITCLYWSRDTDGEFLCTHLLLVNYVSLFVNECQADIWQRLSPFTKWKHSQMLSTQPTLFLGVFCIRIHVISLSCRNTINAKTHTSAFVFTTGLNSNDSAYSLNRSPLHWHAGDTKLTNSWMFNILNLMDRQWCFSFILWLELCFLSFMIHCFIFI